MVILESHFEGRNTYIFGEYIINGCQCFTIDKLDVVCSKFNVSNELKQEVLELYNKNILIEKDWDTLCKHEDYIIRCVLAFINNPDILNILKHDTDWRVKQQVARHYNLDILNYLMNDEDADVRAQAIETLEKNK